MSKQTFQTSSPRMLNEAEVTFVHQALEHIINHGAATSGYTFDNQDIDEILQLSQLFEDAVKDQVTIKIFNGGYAQNAVEDKPRMAANGCK